MAYYGTMAYSLDPCQLYCGIGVVDMGPSGLEFHTEKNAPKRLLKRLEAPGKSEAETRRTSENNSDMSTTCDMVRGSSDVRNPGVGSKVNWDHSESWVAS